MSRSRKPQFTIMKEEDKPDLETAEALFASARIAAKKALPMCAPAIQALHPVFLNPGDGPAPGTFAIDKYYRVYVNRDTIFAWKKLAEEVSAANPCKSCGATSHHPIAYLAGALGHEIWHPLRMHYARAIAIGVTNGMKWNWAIDEEVNDDLMHIYSLTTLPKLCIPDTHLHLPARHGHEDGKLAEHYYFRHIEDEVGQPQGGGQGQPGDGPPSEVLGFGDGNAPQDGDQPGQGQQDADDHGSATDGKPRPWDLGPPMEGKGMQGLSEAEGRMIRKQTAKNIQDAVKARGDMPGGWKMWAEEQLEPPKYDWRQELAKALRWSVRRASGDEERTYRRLGRRCASINYRAILPSTYRPCPIVAIVQDTSGSMGGGKGKAITDSLIEAEGIIKATGAEVAFINCDMQADKAQQVRSARDIDLHGGGGTDMRVGVRAALKERPKPNLIVLFTDGHTEWPEEPLEGGRVGLVVGLVGDHACDINDPPPWVTVVKIVGDDVEVRKGDTT